MDLGIAGRKALVCAASKGLGKACAMSLAGEGVDVTIVARTPGPLEETAGEIRAATQAAVTTVAADITTEAGRARALEACPSPDILVNNAAGPPLGDFRDWGRDEWIAALEANMLSAIFLIKETVDGMRDRGFGRIVNITSGAMKAPISILGLSNGARSGLTGFIAGVARENVGDNVTINNILPGAFDTDRMRANVAAMAEKSGLSFEEALANRARAIPAGRFGDPAEFGILCAYICGAHAGYISGQNLLIDGGAYPGAF